MKRMLLALLGAAPFFAGQAPANEPHHPESQGTLVAQAKAMTEGEVRKVDKAARKITLKHGPIANLDMPGMTMVFQVRDPKLLDRVKAGDRVRFHAEKAGDDFLVTTLEPAQ